jgi:hypothetical protein
MSAVEGSVWQGLEGMFGAGFLIIVVIGVMGVILAPSEAEAKKKKMGEPCQIGRHD